ncbi:Putative ammonia monooxygenase [Corynebacterium occultum]|uniref:Ammonia monooxygenase n=1 Tax=Corynebacterium occultum TaxID=2675219 RepID=A0A6B8WI10_9CORY|nr:AbrB family transcriptional regulator [Corynebacterium occultum]QGU06138.1 Putative ammonia monooxygenase [Corynebacterium occultum]
MTETAQDRWLPLRWVLVAIFSLLLGWGLNRLNVPAAWILAGIFTAGASALVSGKELNLNRHISVSARGVIGILAGLPLIGVPPGQLAGYLLPGLLVTFITLAIGIMGGMLLARAQQEISPETGILSMLAGGASLMPPLAMELGADYRYVALSQYLRMSIVSVTLPLVAVLFTPPGNAAHHSDEGSEFSWLVLGMIILVAVFGEKLGRLIKLPAPTVIGPLLLTVIIGLLLPGQLSMLPPEALRTFAFLSIGWICGGSLSLAALKVFARQLPATLLFIAVLMGGCALSAIPLTFWLDISYFEAYLASSPGALDTVLALSNEGGAGPVVVTIQMVRLLCVIILASHLPAVIRLIIRLFHRGHGA